MRWLPYAATAALTLLGVALWLVLPGLQDGDGKPDINTNASRLALLLTVMLGVVGAATIRLVRANERRRKHLSAIREKLTEQARQSQDIDQRLRLMFSVNPCPMWICDTHTLRFLEVNEAAIKEYGFSRDEFLAMTIKDIRPPEDISALVKTVRWGLQGYSARGQWRHRRRDGSLRFVDISAYDFESEGRTCELVLASDDTKRVRAEEALRQSQSSLQSLVDNAPFGICSSSVEADQFKTVNPAFCRMLGGYPAERLLNMKISTEVYAEPKERSRIIDILRHEGKIEGFEITMLRQDKSKVRVRISGALTADAQGNSDCFEGYVEDLTAQSALEQQIRQVQKLEAVGRLAGGIAHDFNNVLVVINLSTEIMLRQVMPESPLAKSLLQIGKAAERAAGLTKQLLAFGRRQVMQERVLNINAIVADTSHMLQRIIGEDVLLVTKLLPELENSRLDSDQFGQVIMNLAINARDAMPNGGTLHIETDNVELDGSYANDHPPVRPGRYVMLAVSDTGTGIEKPVLARIFDPFFTTKEVGKGTGLGLAIVYGIVKQSNGYIWVYSEIGHGTTFKLYFPATSAAPEHPAARSGARGRSSGETVLLVEDEGVIRSNIAECLRQLGYTVREANSGEAALEACDEHAATIGLVLTDLVMPGMGGHELARELARRHPCMRMLCMSGYTQDNAARRDILVKGSPFLQKPFSVGELSDAVRQAIDRPVFAAQDV